MFVEDSDETHMRININISLPSYPCAVLSVDVQDQLGSHALDVGDTLRKYRLRASGSSASTASAVSSQPLPLEPVRDSAGRAVEAPLHATRAEALLQRGEGCWVLGHLEVKRVPGNFHISAHSRPELLESLLSALEIRHPNVTHTIHHLSFGAPQSAAADWPRFFDGLGERAAAFSPLDRTQRTSLPDPKGSSSFEYYLKIVPTTCQPLAGDTQRRYQFTSAAHEVVGHFQLPAIFFRWDLRFSVDHFALSFFYSPLFFCAWLEHLHVSFSHYKCFFSVSLATC